MADTMTNSQGAMQENSKRVRYAVVGLGYIAQVAVLPAFKHAQENSEIVALVSGDETKRAKLAKKYKVRKTYSYEQYADCLANGEILSRVARKEWLMFELSGLCLNLKIKTDLYESRQ